MGTHKAKNWILIVVICFIALSSWWGYKLIWGTPLNIDHFYNRVLVKYLLQNQELLSSFNMIDNTLLDFHSDELTDSSPSYEAKEAKLYRNGLTVLNSYDISSFNYQEKLSYDIFHWFIEDNVEKEPFLYHSYNINQHESAYNGLPNFMRFSHKVIEESSSLNYIKRLRAFREKFDQIIEGYLYRKKHGVVPPRFALEMVVNDIGVFTNQPAKMNVLYTSFADKLKKLHEIPPHQKKTILNEAEQSIISFVYPAYHKLAGFLSKEISEVQNNFGVWSLPQGDDYYQYLLKHYTTTNITPEAAHQLGISEIARIKQEIKKVVAAYDPALAKKSIIEIMESLSADPKNTFTNGESGRKQALSQVQQFIQKSYNDLPKMINNPEIPPVVVGRIPLAEEASAPPVLLRHSHGIDSHTVTVEYNLKNMAEVFPFILKALTIHEVIPGHHLQHQVKNRLQGVPRFRKLLHFSAYSEGWAMYAESLAAEMGLASSATDRIGLLMSELWRAARLAVDTGIHFKRWTLDQAIEFMKVNTALPDYIVQSEVRRYFVQPGQACSYKIGMIKVQELREQAKMRLGNRFDLKEFHEVILSNGPMPLTILKRTVDHYIETKLNTDV